MKPFRRAVYKGSAYSILRGKTALVSKIGGCLVFLQFDDINTGPFAYGQHPMPLEDVDFLQEVD